MAKLKRRYLINFWKKQTVPGNEQTDIPIIPLNDWGKRQNIQTKKVNKGLTQPKVNK